MELRAAAFGRFLEGESCKEGVGVAVALVEGEAERVVYRDAGADLLRAFLVFKYFGVDAELVLEHDILFELLPLVFLIGDQQISALVQPRGQAELFVKLFKCLEAAQRHQAVQLQPPLGADAGAAATGRAGADGVLFYKVDVLPSGFS